MSAFCEPYHQVQSGLCESTYAFDASLLTEIGPKTETIRTMILSLSSAASSESVMPVGLLSASHFAQLARHRSYVGSALGSSVAAVKETVSAPKSSTLGGEGAELRDRCEVMAFTRCRGSVG